MHLQLRKQSKRLKVVAEGMGMDEKTADDDYLRTGETVVHPLPESLNMAITDYVATRKTA